MYRGIATDHNWMVAQMDRRFPGYRGLSPFPNSPPPCSAIREESELSPDQKAYSSFFNADIPLQQSFKGTLSRLFHIR